MIIAYLDPITGSALMQIALGGLAAIALGWQYVTKGFRNTVKRLRPGAVDSETDHTSNRPSSRSGS